MGQGFITVGTDQYFPLCLTVMSAASNMPPPSFVSGSTTSVTSSRLPLPR